MSNDTILVIRGGAIGDFILTLPVLAALRKRFPGGRIEVLGVPRIAQLAERAGLADAVHNLEERRFAPFFGACGAEAGEAEAVVRGGSLVLSFIHDPERVFETNWTRVSGARWIRGPHRPSDLDSVHASDQLLRPLECLGISSADAVPRMNLALEAAPGPIRELGAWCREHRALAAHPGSGSALKNWPEPSWAALLERCVAQTDLGVLLVGGEAEGDRLNRLAARLPSARLRRAEGLPLGELGAVLSCCGQFIGHDSGITHLAAAVGVPVLALWGPSVVEVWRPRGDRVRVLRHPLGLPAITVESVMEPLAAARD
ncbi:MAG: glycosyltransferase family 9 protein [Verrucomicrobia bacterium]|nr:glycosyltransferase family 9 protein [Verrucomicrobiota bacterium]MBI3871384.1 glycosyltransferase family 9 protein [Verrucomicrobiota bacterium]